MNVADRLIGVDGPGQRRVGIRRKSNTDEWVVTVWVGGKRSDLECYYTDSWQDAKDTMHVMVNEYIRRMVEAKHEH